MNRNKIYKDRFFPNVLKNFAIALIVAPFIYLGTSDIMKERQRRKLINNPTGLIKKVIKKGDTYEKFAINMKKNCKELEKYSKGEIVYKLREKNRYSPGNIPVGKEMEIPTYPGCVKQ
ncbi:hypothetical protein CMI39_00135 [Candidatus Pacearchaeota archaeon]|jgi:hypothetical protein|nr:hypothetical protein [Candidatus Pacearchaeota archaeon]|tara:strand:- start:1284 stop:1637 length:354 start_codon:yes stop_codon:yes gene_type:complete